MYSQCSRSAANAASLQVDYGSQVDCGATNVIRTPPYLKAVSSISFRMLDSIHEECILRFFDNHQDSNLIRLSISPWTLDDSIDYTLTRYPDRCRSVIQRLNGEHARLDYLWPHLCLQVLDEMAKDEDATDPIIILAKLARVRCRSFLTSRRRIAKSRCGLVCQFLRP